MYIHWFPGHMTKAIRAMKEDIANVDSVIYVLDSRAPKSSVNPSFDEIIGNKPRLYVLNKADLVPSEEINKWKTYFSRNGEKCIVTNSTVKGGTAAFINSLREINAEKIDRFKARGIKKMVRAMVIGVPNCGKSTLINSLIAKKKTVTGDRPGVTRGKQWVSIDTYVDLLDTPGTLYPDFSDQIKARNLAFLGSIKEEVVDGAELAEDMIKYLIKNYPEQIISRYKLTDLCLLPSIILTEIAKNKGCVLRGGEYDIDRAAQMVIQDFRKQAFGKIILEKYEG